MSEISRTALFGKLNSLAYKAIEGATVFCKMRGNPYVELEHWFAQLLQAQDSDLHRVPLPSVTFLRTSRTPSNAPGPMPRCSSARRRCAPATSWWAC
jgi:hypothetical protein